MSFEDIFKSSFLENIASISILDILVSLVLAFCLGLFIFLVYKKTYQGVMYSSGFGVTLIALTMITTVVILAVTSNVVLSLGMVGALSRLPLLVHRRGHRPGGGDDSPGCHRQCGHRPDPAGFRQPQVPQPPLHRGAALRQPQQ